MSADPKNVSQSTQENKVSFDILKIYIKNLSLETTNSPTIFNEKWEPEVNVQLANSANPLSNDGLIEICLRITVTAKVADKTAFLIEVEQAGVFSTVGFEAAQMAHMHGAFCPTILFPYARETIDSTLVKAGFPPVQLAPVNFDGLYIQRLEQMAAENQQKGNA